MSGHFLLFTASVAALFFCIGRAINFRLSVFVPRHREMVMRSTAFWLILSAVALMLAMLTIMPGAQFWEVINE